MAYYRRVFNFQRCQDIRQQPRNNVALAVTGTPMRAAITNRGAIRKPFRWIREVVDPAD